MTKVTKILLALKLAHVEWRVDVTWNTDRGLGDTGITFPYGTSYRAPSFEAAVINIANDAKKTGPVASEDDGRPIISVGLNSASIEQLVIYRDRCIDQRTVYVQPSPVQS
jgi:hypothetical protein